MNKETGTGWDPVKRIFSCDDEWWKRARAVSVFVFTFVFTCFFLPCTNMWSYLAISGYSWMWEVQEATPSKRR
jgi:hypothetical protein